MEAAGLRAHQRGIAAIVSVHPQLGMGGTGRHDAGVCRLGAHIDLQEVKSMRVRMVCIHLPKALGSVVRWMASRRRN